jgi:hypothetical protein
VAAVAADSVLTWNWRREYYLDVSHTGSGTVNIASAWLPSGTNVTLRATPRDYYRFLGWSGDVAPAQAGDRTIILAMDAARSVLAAFDTNRLPRGTVLELR